LWHVPRSSQLLANAMEPNLCQGLDLFSFAWKFLGPPDQLQINPYLRAMMILFWTIPGFDHKHWLSHNLLFAHIMSLLQELTALPFTYMRSNCLSHYLDAYLILRNPIQFCFDLSLVLILVII
jgi:hypothetical protein